MFSFVGVLIDFISIPVTVGFTSATSVIIAVSQVKGLLGLKFDSNGSFLDVLKNVSKHIHETHLPDLYLGFSCIFVLLALRVSVSSNAVFITVVLCSCYSKHIKIKI